MLKLKPDGERKLERREEGSALVLVITLVATMVTLGYFSLYASVDLHKMVNKSKVNREAIYLAEAGLSEGASLLKLDDADGFNDNELTVAYPTESVTIGSSTYTVHRWIDTKTVEPRKKYKVWLINNSDAGYVSGASNDTIGADTADADGAVLLISEGWVEDNSGNVVATAYIKGLYKLVAYESKYAVLTKGNLQLGGNVSIDGSVPSIHTNGDLTSIGNSDSTEGGVSASGTVSGSVNLIAGGTTGTGGQTTQDVPSFSAGYYRGLASSLVWDTAANPIGAGTCQRAPSTGSYCVEICNDAGTYEVKSPSPSGGAVCQTPAINKGGAFYFNGPVKVETSGAWASAVLATGRITLQSGTQITGTLDLPGVAFVSDADVIFTGGVSIGSAGNQLGMFAGTGFDFSGGGNKTLYGPVIASDMASLTDLTGNITIHYDNNTPPKNGPPTGKLISWTQIQ